MDTVGAARAANGRPRTIRDIHDTAATGFGCDFLHDTVVEGVLAQRCGRQDPGGQMGGAGLGIGVGGWGPVERLTVSDCTAVGNGTNGIFLELQQEDWEPPRGIRITSCHCEDNRFGISGWGADGLIVTASTMIANHEAGCDVSSQGTTSVGGRGGIVTGCVIDGNLRDGVGFGNSPGPYAFRGNRISSNGRYGFWGAATRGPPRTSSRRPGPARQPRPRQRAAGRAGNLWGRRRRALYAARAGRRERRLAAGRSPGQAGDGGGAERAG
ncbi:right-handed parallel beta-helix repeat-containing protein [Streptomyces sp. JB150]|uniref:right-handed parallel beta-helix repeat-containing protein n=1 Tax=Streptomyces sp. JB150 TaxID=2714844 RepID=UPI001F0F1A69|nr:right-handed parallel beta-helix repeat-containing protein [Streptomyces sp. JB150]